MKNSLLKIKCYSPEISDEIKNKQEFVGLIMESMRKDGNVKCAGYFKEADLQNDLLYHMGKGNITQYKPLSSSQKQSIEKMIRAALIKCHEELHHPDLPIFVFAYPWFPDKGDQSLFQGVTAFATYYTIHLFIDFDFYTQASLNQTIAHEWNHLVFYRYHEERQNTLCDCIVMEGFAEIFREEVMGGKPAPWSLALTKAESSKQFKLIEGLLDSKSVELYREVFWGNNEFKRWTGYSIGYEFAKEFIKNFPELSWEELIKIKSKDVLSAVIKNENQN